MNVVRPSALHTSCLNPQLMFLVLISIRGWVGHSAIVQLEGLSQWIILITPLGTEPATFQPVVQFLNQVCHHMPPVYMYVGSDKIVQKYW